MEQEKISSEIFYLVGALRDGCLTTGWTVKYKQKLKTWLSDVILPMLNETFNLNLTENCIYLHREDGKVDTWYIAFRNKKVWKELSTLKCKKLKTVPEKKYYTMGFWDADGGCPKSPVVDKKNYIKFTQKDKASLDELKFILENDFGITCGDVCISEKKNTGNIWRFVISNKNGMVKFCNEIGSFHPEKRLRLERLREIISLKNN